MKKHYVGIDLGGTFIKFITLDSGLKPGKKLQLPTPAGPDAVIDQMAAGARQVMEANGVTAAQVGGVGIGSPGPLDLKNGVVIKSPNLPGFNNLPLRDRVAEKLSLPAELENDANAAAYGEFLCGAGKGKGDMCMFTLGTGVGGGVVIDGKVIQGFHGIGAELGHQIIVPDGELCGCGQRGCLEQYASAMFMARRAARAIEAGRASSLKAVLDRNGELDAKDVNQARKQGDALAAEVWDTMARSLAQASVNLCRIVDPDVIVLAGGMVNAGDDVMIPVRQHFAKLHWNLTDIQTRIEVATLGSDAGAIGAAGVAWAKFGQ